MRRATLKENKRGLRSEQLQAALKLGKREITGTLNQALAGKEDHEEGPEAFDHVLCGVTWTRWEPLAIAAEAQIPSRACPSNGTSTWAALDVAM